MKFEFGLKPSEVAAALRELADRFESGALPIKMYRVTLHTTDDFVTQRLMLSYAEPRAEAAALRPLVAGLDLGNHY